MKYLKKFETTAQYTAAKDGLILPNVSLITDNNKVEYNPLTPPTPPIIDGHEYVDLGLPSGTKWATMNVGASTVTDYGNYYQYGKGADDVSVTSGQSNYSGTENPLAASADTAVQVWGGQWHMPTSAQCQELLDNTTYEWVTDYQGSGINGGTFTSNGQILFIPAAGYYVVEEQSMFDGFYYNSSTPNNNGGESYGLITSGPERDIFVYDLMVREDGCPVRPVVG